MSEVSVEQLEEKVKEYKLRIFDMAEQFESLNQSLQAQQTQTQEFVTAVMQVIGMELTEQVMLNDVLTELKGKLGIEDESLEGEIVSSEG